MGKREKPLGKLSSINALLTLVLLDSEQIPHWEPLDEEPEGDDMGGHPQKVTELLEDEDFVSAELKVGKGKALVLNLEGMTGEAEIRRLEDGTLALLEPPRDWWDDEDNYGERKDEVAQLFADALGSAPKVGKEKRAGRILVPSGKLVVFDSNESLESASKAAKKSTPEKVVGFGENDGGVVLGLTPGPYVLWRRVIEPPWADDQPLVVAYLRRA
ncbi:hypothetical protein [Myxococcus landrumensis]|uniref:Uncharacterized protein n=1 Tax=Myxococcus landrumensis TaxID=2813577 RepID=A0ABX7NJB2_9BACT|nr:hypothetical protein [Myxococcus landrumus]QSQ17569.1 hypothetical protein JY572_16675 [Myxococcus landrumus]